MRKISLGVLVILLAVSFTPTTALALPEVQCFQNFSANMAGCAELPSFWQRSLCGADAELEFVGCVGRQISPWK